MLELTVAVKPVFCEVARAAFFSLELYLASFRFDTVFWADFFEESAGGTARP